VFCSSSCCGRVRNVDAVAADDEVAVPEPEPLSPKRGWMSGGQTA